MIYECSGSEKIRQPSPETFICPNCKEEMEIWTDETEGICPKCKTVINRNMGTSCLDWCSSAKDCLGKERYNKYLRNKTSMLKERLLAELEQYFGKDAKRINHAKKVLEFAEELLRREKGDWHIVVPAAILHDVGIKVAEEKYGSNSGRLQEKEGPAIAKQILEKTGARKEHIAEVCEIIAHHHTPGKINSQNFKLLYDADWLVNLKDEVDLNDKEKLKTLIEKVFLSVTAKELAEKLYL